MAPPGSKGQSVENRRARMRSTQFDSPGAPEATGSMAAHWPGIDSEWPRCAHTRQDEPDLILSFSIFFCRPYLHLEMSLLSLQGAHPFSPANAERRTEVLCVVSPGGLASSHVLADHPSSINKAHREISSLKVLGHWPLLLSSVSVLLS